MDKNLRIGLDFDGVIADSGRQKYDLAKKIYGIEVPADLFKREYVVVKGILSEDAYNQLQYLVYGTREHGLSVPPVEGVIEYIRKLLNAGCAVKVITSRSGEWADIAKEWLQDKGIDIEVVGVGKGISKREAAQGLHAYVDDDFDKLEPLVGAVPNLFLFSWDHNSHIHEGGHVKRVLSWKNLYDSLASLEIK